VKTPPGGAIEGEARPRCVVVTGPRGAGKTRWVQERIRLLVTAAPALRCGVVLAEEGRTRFERFARANPGLAVRRVLLACPCCPAQAFLPETVRALVAETGAEQVFLELPAVAAAGLLGEFDRELGWPREVVLLLDPRWERLHREGDAPPFLAVLAGSASTILTPAAGSFGDQRR
jgi:Ni2+-binding GTPase involved in maturation of urease and hydrogenase